METEPSDKPLTPEQELQMLKLKNFMINNEARINQWETAHTPYIVNPETKEIKLGKCTIPLPMVWDESVNDFIWLNRKMRRG